MNSYLALQTQTHRGWRRATLALLVLAALAALATPLFAADPKVSRETVLRDLARNVIAAGYDSLDAKCRALTHAVGELNQPPTSATLAQARAAWIAAADAAAAMRCFQTGPLASRESAATFYYGRVSPPFLEGALRATNALSPSLLDELSPNVKGLFGIQYLLFGHTGYPSMTPVPASAVLGMLSGPDSARRRSYLGALAEEVAVKAGQVAADWNTPGDSGAAAQFAAAGEASLNQVVNQLAQALEDLDQKHLNFVLVLPSPISRQQYRVERSPSGSSLSGVIASLEGVEKFYRGVHGPGLAALVQPLNPALGQRIADQFAAALAATRAIGEPLEQAVVDKREALQKAVDQVHALEILLKVDLASALGVTITFSSGDSD